MQEETGIEPLTEGVSVNLHYLVEGENVILFDTYYTFYNDIINQ